MPSIEPPKVTGLSPKEGSPGTKITVRGENLGYSQDDVVSLTVCGVECLMYVEWQSPSKIVARCGAVTPGMRGDVIVTTKSGGKGTCTVQFRVSLEPIGRTKESAVWIDETSTLGSTYGGNRPTSPSQLHPDDPLGLSDESNVGRFAEEDLHDYFPDGSGNILSENFVPTWYLLENHHGASFDDLKAGLTCLRRKVTQHKDGPSSFLKSNVMSIVDCMDVLGALQAAVEKDKQALNADLTDRLEQAVVKCKREADALFQEMLIRKDKADSTRNALSVLQRFRFLFNLPANIEKNIQKGDYDIVINDYARAKSLFHDTEVAVFKKVYQEVEQRIEKFRHMLGERLKQLPLTVEEQKRLIKYLVNLEAPADPAWECVSHNKMWLLSIMNSSKEKHQALASSSEDEDWDNQGLDSWQCDSPQVVKFIVELTEIFSEHFPNMWKLGQAYLTGQLHIREVESQEHQGFSRSAQFKNMIMEVTYRLCNLIRMALLPESLHSLSVHQLSTLGSWPKSQESIAPWLPHCLRYIRNCYISLLKLDLPEEVLNAIQQLIFDLRLYAMKTLFMQAAEDVQHLDERENWVIDIDDHNGGITQLPLLFENRVAETLQLVRETVLQCGPRETDVFSHINVQASIKQLSQTLVQAFAIALEKMGSSEYSQKLEDRQKEQTGSKLGLGSQGYLLAGENDELVSQDARFLIILSNCNYTLKSIIPRLQESFIRHGYPNMTLVIKSCQNRFRAVETKLFETYIEKKCDPVVGAIEPRMYSGCFTWESCEKPADVSTYIKETLMDMIEIHAEVFAVCPPFVSKVLTKVVESVVEEMARVYECVPKFEGNGNMQATLDLRAFEDAMSAYKTSNTSKYFMLCRSKLQPFSSSKDTELVNDLLKNLRSQFKLQLLCFKEESIVTV